MLKNTLCLFLLLTVINFAQILGPKISIPVSAHDFGQIKQGDIVKFEFDIVNSGDDLLKIKNVNASCGCTAAKPDKNELGPGEATKLKVEFNSAGRLGKQVKTIFVETNDPKMPMSSLNITSIVVEPDKFVNNVPQLPKISFRENVHDFGTVNEGVKVGYTFDFENKGAGVLEIKSVNPSCGCTAAMLSNNTLQPGEKGTIKIEFDTANRSGKTSKTISVISNDPEEPAKTLIFTADVIKSETNK